MFKKNWIKNTNLRRGLFWTAIVLVWELVSKAGIWEAYLFPSPEGVAGALLRGISDQSLLIGTLVSMKRVTIGYGISLVVGVSLGLLMGSLRWVNETLGSMVVALQSLPSICWLPLALLWFGLSETAILFVVVMGAVLSVAIATDHGVKHVDPLLIHAARTMGAGPRQLAFQVILPAALPSIISGMKQGWSFAWRSLMAGELLFVSLGLGHLLMVGRELNDMNRVVAVMVVIVLLGVAIDQLIFTRLQERIRRIWGLAAE